MELYSSLVTVLNKIRLVSVLTKAYKAMFELGIKTTFRGKI
jgi:hypothetical protein